MSRFQMWLVVAVLIAAIYLASGHSPGQEIALPALQNYKVGVNDARKVYNNDVKKLLEQFNEFLLKTLKRYNAIATRYNQQVKDHYLEYQAGLVSRVLPTAQCPYPATGCFGHQQQQLQKPNSLPQVVPFITSPQPHHQAPFQGVLHPLGQSLQQAQGLIQPIVQPLYQTQGVVYPLVQPLHQVQAVADPNHQHSLQARFQAVADPNHQHSLQARFQAVADPNHQHSLQANFQPAANLQHFG